jgi:hypothetical protein
MIVNEKYKIIDGDMFIVAKKQSQSGNQTISDGQKTDTIILGIIICQCVYLILYISK